VLAFGHEGHHVKMRVRIVLELLAFEEQYFNTNFINGNGSCSGDLVKWYSILSAHADNRLVPREVLQREVQGIISSGQFMGQWQLHALASVLKTRIQCVYPTCGGLMIKQLYRRCLG
jgi:hypothetical protein